MNRIDEEEDNTDVATVITAGERKKEICSCLIFTCKICVKEKTDLNRPSLHYKSYPLSLFSS